MKNLKTPLGLIALLSGAMISSQALRAAPVWNASGGGNWSASGNWNPVSIPGTVDDVQFQNVGAGNQNTVDAAFTINSLSYSQDNGLTHTTMINPGTTLTVNRTTTGDVLSVNSTTAATTASTQVPVTVLGAGGTLSIGGAGDLVVRQGNGTAGSHMATLDLSGLDTFNANIGRMLVGQANAGAAVNRPSGTLILAKTNNITMNGATAPQVMVQDGGSNANGGTASVLSLGQVNFLNADNLRLGGQKGNGNVLFNAVFSNPSVVFRSHDGVSRVALMAVGDNSFVTSGNSTVANVDLGAGSADALVDLAYVGRGNPGPGTGTCAGTLTLGAGTFDVNTLEIGYGIATGAGGASTGTVNVNNNTIVTTNINNGVVSTGAVLVVNSSLRLARTNGGAGAIVGTLNVTGGTVGASNIVAGGGNSSIFLNSGSTLIISNTAGTLAAPIRNFSIADSTLVLPALNGGGVMSVSNLTSSGANIINISSIPAIGSYPAVFTLISYRSGNSGTFTIGSLPTATPSYSGSLIDIGNGVVQLQLNSGPVTDLSLRWTGVSDNTWDLGTVNWLYQGNQSSFFNGGAAVFDDNTTQANINLTANVSPSTMTVSNNTQQYDFSGFGNISGASLLTKKGSATAIIENQGVDSFGTVLINSGTLQVGAGDTNGEISALNITNNAALVVNRSGTLDLSSAINGTGTLTKLGNGTLVLSGTSGYSGATTLGGGGLQVDGALSGPGALTTSSGTLLSGSGSYSGPVTASGAVNPGTVNGAGTLTLNNNLTLSSGSKLTFDLSANPGTGNDVIAVSGNLNLNNNAVAANFLGVPSPGANYPIITYSGSLTGNLNPTVTGSHFTMALDTSNPGTIYLEVTGGTGANLKWSSTGDTTWDSTTTNWTDLSGNTPSLFYSGDSVLFDDTATQPLVVIPSGVSVYPSVISNISDSVSYFISGPGKISGGGNLVKAGQSTLTISSANDFTGTVDIQGGILKAGSGTALGSAANGTTVEPGGTLDLGGQSLAGEVITIAGTGFNDQGAIINTGGAVNTAFRSLILSSNAFVGGGGTWAVNNSGGAASLSTQGQPWSLTKVGPGQFGLQNLSTVDSALANIEIQSGTLEFNGLTPNMGDPNYTNIVDAGATLQFASDSVVWNKYFNLNGNGSANTVNNGTGALTELAGPVEIHGDVIINVGGTSMTISSPISGDGSLTKTGTSPLILSNNNTYAGDTHINTGAMRLAGNASISNSLNIFINAGATLTVTGRVDATFTLITNQTLNGNGVVAGSLTTLAGSTLSPGLSAIGGLTVSNSIVLGGTNIFELNQDLVTNDVLNANGSITYGGLLSLVNVGSDLTNGASFKLFKASSYNGSFASISPTTPGTGLLWDTTRLSSGIIGVTNSVVPGPTTNATITKVTVSGTNIVVHGTNNNVPNTNFRYVVLSSTNLLLPLTNWTPVYTNSFIGSGGTFDYTNPIVPGQPRQFLNVKMVP